MVDRMMSHGASVSRRDQAKITLQSRVVGAADETFAPHVTNMALRTPEKDAVISMERPDVAGEGRRRM